MTRLSVLTSVWKPWVVAVATTALAIILGVGLVGHFRLGPVDDAFISLRYASNWATGQGLTFNPGEIVEGYTNFLLVALLAAGVKSGADPVTALKVMSWTSYALLAASFGWFTARHLFPERGLLATVVAALALLSPVFFCWASSGMESCLYAALLVASTALVLAEPSTWTSSIASVLLVLAALTRPEAVALFPVLVAIYFLRHRSLRQTGWFAAVFVVAYGIYFFGRWLHFGYLLPNTFYAKLDYGNFQVWGRGSGYLGGFVLATPLLFLMSVLSVVRIRRAPDWAKACVALVATQLLIVVYEGGDHFAMYRFMVPVLPFLTALALFPCTLARDRAPQSTRVATWLGVLAVVIVGASGLSVARQVRRDKEPLRTQLEWHRFEVELAREWTRIGRWMGDYLPRAASVVALPIGAIGYHSGLKVIDPLGIVDPVIAHQESELGAGYSGHEKFDPDYILTREPEYILLLDVSTPIPVPEEVLGREIWGEANQELLRQPRLERDYRYESVPVGRAFLNLHVRRDLPSLTSVAR